MALKLNFTVAIKPVTSKHKIESNIKERNIDAVIEELKDGKFVAKINENQSLELTERSFDTKYYTHIYRINKLNGRPVLYIRDRDKSWYHLLGHIPFCNKSHVKGNVVKLNNKLYFDLKSVCND